ncbi:uncharacterized protein OCT59_028004 [Rhizophagus irregularis]|uniref:uncharacterized protein n=1 Tax=Rhizophagus irregularis TaxID=588596 RepID=UPI003332E74D|nr:hypothetical protein OCT59_028004 [Rhizophagus irregularis]
MTRFIDKEVIVNVGAVVQKVEDLCLDGFFGFDIIPKNNEYSLRWNYIPIEEAYRFWFKELTYNTISANGSNVLIDWSVSFKLINNEVTTPRNVNIVKMPRLDVLG